MIPRRLFIRIICSMFIRILLILLLSLVRLALEAHIRGTYKSSNPSPPPQSESEPSPRHWSSPFISGAFTSLVTLILSYKNNVIRDAEYEDLDSVDTLQPPRGLGQSEIKAINTFLYSTMKALKIGRGSVECAVCLSDFQDEDLLRVLPTCNHEFHPKCVDPWLRDHSTCPVCRIVLVLPKNLAPAAPGFYERKLLLLRKRVTGELGGPAT